MDNVKDGRFYAQTRADSKGFFSIDADYSHLQLLVSSRQLKRRQVDIDEWPAITELQRRIEEYYPDSRYGRKGLILDPRSRIEVYRDKTFLSLDRDFDYESDAILKGKWFTCREVASDLNINLKRFEEFREAHLARSSCDTSVSIPHDTYCRGLYELPFLDYLSSYSQLYYLLSPMSTLIHTLPHAKHGGIDR